METLKEESDLFEGESDTIKRPVNISKNAGLINVGSIDAPVYRWLQYEGTMTGKELERFYRDDRANGIPASTNFSDIHIISTYFLDGKVEESAPFQVFPKEKELALDRNENYSIKTWWGDTSIKIDKDGQTFVLVRVLNLQKPFISTKKLGYRFEKVPSILNFFSEEINSESFRLGSIYNISIKPTAKPDLYDVMIIDEFSQETFQQYKLISKSKEQINTSLIRYYDPKEDRIYFVQSGYLEPAK